MGGYVYEQTSEFFAQYGMVASDMRWTDSVRNTWNNVNTLDKCARYNYYEGVGGGLTCAWFDYSASAQLCRCYGSMIPLPTQDHIADQSGTNAYAINKKCSRYTEECAVIPCANGLDLWIKKIGEKSCVFGITYDTWECAHCPVFSGPGYSQVKVLQDKAISSREEHSNNGCTPYFNLRVEEIHTSFQFGFDIEISLKIGCNFYSLVTVYGRAAIEIPFRINVPEMDNTVCADASASCGTNDLVVSSTVSMDLVFYVGVEADFGELEDIVDAIVDGSDNVEVDAGIEMTVASVSILPVTPIACKKVSPPVEIKIQIK